MLKKFIGLFKKQEIVTSGDLVDKLDWAQNEIKETEERMVDLIHRLHEGAETMASVVSESQAIITRHQEILAKADSRRLEMLGKVQTTKDILDKFQEVK